MSYNYIFLGAVPSDKVLGEMVKEAHQLNFTGFLSLFSEKMSGKFRVSLYPTPNVNPGLNPAESFWYPKGSSNITHLAGVNPHQI